MTDHQQQTPPPQKPKRKKMCKYVLCGTSAAIGLPTLALIVALATESGQQGIIHLVDKMMDSLSIEQVSGNLGQGLVLQNVRYQSAGVDTTVEQARLQLNWRCLWQRDICIDDISISKPVISIDTAQLPPADEKEKAPTQLSRISLPIGIHIKQIAVDDLSLAIDKNQLHLGQFHSALSLTNDNGLTISPTAIDNLQFTQYSTTNTQQNTQAKPNQPIDWAALEQQFSQPLLANLDDIILPFDMHIQDIQGKNWQYDSIVDQQPTQSVRIPQWQIQADATGDQVTLNTLTLESSLGNINGKGQLQLSGDFPVDMQLQANIHKLSQHNQPILPATHLDFTLSKTLKNKTALLLKTQGGINAELSAQLELNQPKLPLHITLTSPTLQYAVTTPKDPLQVDNLDLRISGNLLDYQVQLNGSAKGMGIPATEVSLTGKGGLSAAQLDNLQINALKGHLTLQGKADWKDGIQWQSQSHLDNINVGAYVKDFPATLSGNFSSAGFANSHDWQVAVPELNLQGHLSGRALSLKGELTANSDTLLQVPNLALVYGENTLQAQGKLSEQSDFNLTINAPNLRGLYPDFAASLMGKVDLKGKLAEPSLNLDLTGQHIQFQDLRLNKLAVKSHIQSEQQVQGQLNLQLDGFQQGEINIPNASLSLTGNEKNHQLQLRATGEPVGAQLNVTGDFERATQQWKGTITQTDISTPAGHLKNNQFTVNYDNKTQQAVLSPHCWTHPELELCFPQNLNVGKTGNIAFEIKKFDLNLINKLAEQEMLKGHLRSKGKMAWFDNKPMQANVEINGDNLDFNQKVDHKTFRLSVPKLNLNGQLENNNVAVKSVIQLAQGHLNTDIKLTDIAQSRKLSGNIKLSQLNLDLVNQLLSSGNKVNGNINADLNMAGSLTSPLINGEIKATGLMTKIRSLPFDINNGDIALRFHGNHSTLQGYIQSPDGRLDVEGDANWKDINNWHTRVHAKADQFRLDIPAIAKIKLSPDVEMRATPKLLELSGKVDIPWARIAVESLPDSAVSVSSDEVILDGAKPREQLPKLASKTADGMLIKSNLKINVGDDVSLSAYGLNTKLQGVLEVRQEKGNLGLFGQINLKEGRYASFGQDLLIRKGQVSFSGLPLQPQLNIEAIRNPEAMEDSNVVAGVRVIGLADSPQVNIFSEPGLPQDQALAYLLTGRSLENSGEAGSGGSIGAALLGIGLAKSGKVVGKIGETFGIQDLNLGTAGVGDSSKVVVSGNITPKLQIKYGVGLFDGLAEVTLRYKLFPQLYLQSVSGVNQAFDLLYQFEF